MSQAKTVTWTNPSSAVAMNLAVGFAVSQIIVSDTTNGGQFYWNSSMPNASYITMSTGATTTTNGVTPYASASIYGAAITGFTNASNGVITASNIALVGIKAGDTIQVAEVADNDTNPALTLNAQFTVSSVTSTNITVNQNTTSYNHYVSGGVVTRIQDSNGYIIPTFNFGLQGVTLGTGAVGGNNGVMVAQITGDNSVT